MDTTEADWIEGCKAGRRRAFEPLVRRYGPRAYRFALGIVGDAEEAKDLSQEAFIRAYGAMERFDETRSFYPWFLTILRNVCLSYSLQGGEAMIVSTCKTVPGREITAVLGLARGNTIRARHIGRDITAAIKGLHGGKAEVVP